MAMPAWHPFGNGVLGVLSLSPSCAERNQSSVTTNASGEQRSIPFSADINPSETSKRIVVKKQASWRGSSERNRFEESKASLNTAASAPFYCAAIWHEKKDWKSSLTIRGDSSIYRRGNWTILKLFLTEAAEKTS